MNISKYFFIYLGLATMLISSMLVPNSLVKVVFYLILVFLFLFLGYDFLKKKTNILYSKHYRHCLGFDYFRYCTKQNAGGF